MPTPDPVARDPDDLLLRARAGDLDALGRLLEPYRPYLTLLARLQVGHRLRGKVDPADLVQEAFLKAHRHFAGFAGGSEAELAGWLRQILAREAADQVRRFAGAGKRDVRLERALADDLERSGQALGRVLAARQSSPSQKASRREQGVLLAAALDRLPADYREAIVLRHLEGLPFEAVAARMGRTQDSVKKLWARGLNELRLLLEGE